MQTYEDFQKDMASRGFIITHTTETGFNELRNIGFDYDDICSIEMDMQAGFDKQEAINAAYISF